jgi:hypothetical protein
LPERAACACGDIVDMPASLAIAMPPSVRFR